MIVYDMICCCMYPAPRPPPNRLPPDRPPPHPTPSAHLLAHSPAPLATSDEDDDGNRSSRSDTGEFGLTEYFSEFQEILDLHFNDQGQYFPLDQVRKSVGDFMLAEMCSQSWKNKYSYILNLWTNSYWGISCHGRVNFGRK